MHYRANIISWPRSGCVWLRAEWLSGPSKKHSGAPRFRIKMGAESWPKNGLGIWPTRMLFLQLCDRAHFPATKTWPENGLTIRAAFFTEKSIFRHELRLGLGHPTDCAATVNAYGEVAQPKGRRCLLCLEPSSVKPPRPTLWFGGNRARGLRAPRDDLPTRGLAN